MAGSNESKDVVVTSFNERVEAGRVHVLAGSSLLRAEGDQ
jgi:hypothetical protein